MRRVHSQGKQLAAGPNSCAGVRCATAVTAMKIVPCTAGLSRMWQENVQTNCYVLLYSPCLQQKQHRVTTLTSAACSRFPTQQAAGMFVVWR